MTMTPTPLSPTDNRPLSGKALQTAVEAHPCTQQLTGNAALDVLRAALADAGVVGQSRADLIGFFCNHWNEAIAAIQQQPEPVAPTDESEAEEALRSLACWLGVGGYNSPTVDAKLYEQKIREGVTVYSQLHGMAARDLAETVLHMDLITPRGIRARELARQVLGIVPPALQQKEEPSGWKPIESAPEDTNILVATTGGWVDTAFWTDEDGQGRKWWWLVSANAHAKHPLHPNLVPTHWMPLPSHPTASPSPAEKPAGLANVVLDEQEANFLAARLRRLLTHFGYHLPDFAKDDASLIRIAGSCIGGLLTTLSASEKPAEGEPGGVGEVDETQALDLLEKLFDAYENGVDVYEDPDEQAGHLGHAVKLDDATFHACADLLNRRRPRGLDAPGEGQR